MYAIGFCIDEAYLVPALVTLTSVAQTITPRERAEVAVRLLTPDLKPCHADTAAQVVRRLGFGSFAVRWCAVPDDFNIVEGKYISTATYLRFRFTESFVARSHLIYLDADVLVVEDISTPLTSVSDGQVVLVRDEINHTLGEGRALPGFVASRAELRGQPYFNAGMVWLASNTLRHLNAGAYCAMRRHSEHIHFNDQDALNLWLIEAGVASEADGRFNRFELDRLREESDWVGRVIRNNVIRSEYSALHFIGPLKPWLNRTPRTDGVRLYRSFLRETMSLVRRAGDLTLDFNSNTAHQSLERLT